MPALLLPSILSMTDPATPKRRFPQFYIPFRLRMLPRIGRLQGLDKQFARAASEQTPTSDMRISRQSMANKPELSGLRLKVIVI